MPEAVREDEIAAIFERLRKEVREPSREEPEKPTGPLPKRLRARFEAERLWAVTVDRPVEKRPGIKGRVGYPVKLAVRKLVRWYIEPVVTDQRAFNDVTVKLIDELYERLQETTDPRLLTELNERLTRLERRPRPASAATPAAGPQPVTAVPDYFGFEARMRGATADVRARQRPYVEDFADAAPVLDVGCGRGEFLGLLRDAGIAARGVDQDADMVAYCLGEGLDVEEADALEYLGGLDDDSLGGIFAGQVVEHLQPAVLVRFLGLGAQKLRPGGVLVAETINPLALSALKNYFADPTHAQPLVPETLALLARQAGFERVDVRFVNELDEEEILHPVELPEEPAFDAARHALTVNTNRLNELLFGPQDYALVART